MRARVLTEQQLDDVCKGYSDGATCQQLADSYGVSPGTISNGLRARDVPRTRHFKNLSAHDRSVAVQMRNDGYSHYKIAAHLGVSRPAIGTYLRELADPKLSRSEAQRKYHCDESYFDQIDSERKAYWLGFIAADGCVTRGDILSFTLAAKDHNHLVLFNLDLACSYPVNHFSSNGYPTSMLAILSQRLTEALIGHGIVRRKTHVLEWPTNLGLLTRHYLRGYFDGDGCWATPTTYRGSTFSMIGRIAFLVPCQKFLIDQCGLPNTKMGKRRLDAEHGSLVYSGNKKLLCLANFLYEDATVYLDRKRDIVLNHYLSLPKYRDQLRFG